MPTDFETNFLNKLRLEDELDNQKFTTTSFQYPTKDKTRLYRSWQIALIIKLLGKK